MPARVQHLADPGGVSEQVPHGYWPPAGIRGDEPVGAQVVVGRRIEVDEPLLLQLHHRDRGEGLGKRADPENGVHGDRRAEAISARPCPEKNSSDPSRTTPTARPTAGRRLRIPRTPDSTSSDPLVAAPPSPCRADDPHRLGNGQGLGTDDAPIRKRTSERPLLVRRTSARALHVNRGASASSIDTDRATGRPHLRPRSITWWTLSARSRTQERRATSASLPRPLHLATYIGWGAFEAFQIPYSLLERRQKPHNRGDQGRAGHDRPRWGQAASPEGLGSQESWALWQRAKLDELLTDGESRTTWLLRFTLSHPAIDTIIPGTLNPNTCRERSCRAGGPLAR